MTESTVHHVQLITALHLTYISSKNAVHLVRHMQDEVCQVVAADLPAYVCRQPAMAATSTLPWV